MNHLDHLIQGKPILHISQNLRISLMTFDLFVCSVAALSDAAAVWVTSSTNPWAEANKQLRLYLRHHRQLHQPDPAIPGRSLPPLLKTE